MDDLIIGVDAGGTNTRAALYDEAGNQLAAARGGYGSVLVDSDAATRHISEAIAECLAGREGKIRIYVGAAGITAGDTRAQLTAHLQKQFPGAAVRVETDAKLALYAIMHGKDSLLVIAGTGSIAYAKHGDAVCRMGGWGNILGDEGSGYDICRRALSNITLEHDRGQGYGHLSQQLMAALDTDVWGVIAFVHRVPKGEVAALLPLVERVALEGDETAARLLDDAGAALARLVEMLYQRMGFTGRLPLGVKGGVLEKTPAVLAALTRRLDPARFAIHPESAPSELGAYYLYLEEKAHEGKKNDQLHQR